MYTKRNVISEGNRGLQNYLGGMKSDPDISDLFYMDV